jgi:hypothetical protein
MWPIIKKAVNSDLSTPLNTLINNVRSVVDTVNTNTGSNADAANASGSIHAKIKELRTYIAGLFSPVQKARKSVVGSFYIGYPNAYVVCLNVTGKGSLKMLAIGAWTDSEGTFGGKVKLTIDGVVVGKGEGIVVNASSRKMVAPVTHEFFSKVQTGIGFSMYAIGSGDYRTGPMGMIDIPFRSSLKIEGMYSDSSPYSADVLWIYETES